MYQLPNRYFICCPVNTYLFFLLLTVYFFLYFHLVQNNFPVLYKLTCRMFSYYNDFKIHVKIFIIITNKNEVLTSSPFIGFMRDIKILYNHIFNLILYK